MSSMADKIMQRISENASGRWVCTPRDFLDIGSREAVDQALSRLVKAGRLRRVGRGLYHELRISAVLKRPARRSTWMLPSRQLREETASRSCPMAWRPPTNSA